MRILLHLCCAPCSTYSVEALRQEGADLLGLFYNPNIHPFAEYLRRQETMKSYSQQIALPVIWPEGHEIASFFREVSFREEERCRICYHLRLSRAAEAARAEGCDGFSTTLLISPYQKHDLLREVGFQVAEEKRTPFVYRDLRPGWARSRQEARRLDLYRQSYCGCLYSEQERLSEKRRRAGCSPASIPSARS